MSTVKIQVDLMDSEEVKELLTEAGVWFSVEGDEWDE